MKYQADLAFVTLNKKQLRIELSSRVELISELREHRDTLLQALKDAQGKKWFCNETFRQPSDQMTDLLEQNEQLSGPLSMSR
jgi:uncharacterized coiled-coil DUF342 family protein